MKKPIAARRVGGDGEIVARGICQCDVRVLLDAQIATGGRLAIEGRGKDTVLDRHTFGPTVEEDVETPALPWRDHVPHLIRCELDGEDQAPRTEPKDLLGAVLIHDVHAIVGDDIASVSRELGDETEVAAEDR